MEGDAGPGQLTPTEAAADSGVAAETAAAAQTDTAATAESAESAAAPPSRLRGRWLVGIAAVLVVAAAGLGAGGYLAYRAHQQNRAADAADAAAVAAAEDCLLAIHAPDPAAMEANQRKILECSTGAFTAQAPLWISVLAEAYATGDVHVEMLDMHTAVERHHDNGSIDVLAAFRVFVSSTNQQVNYRLRVNMAPDNGQYKIADVAQVSQ
ncbi:hypothetical protein H7J77_13055 [Mycolicibacillus parakoreensis]|uniref:Mce protein n=1 Tax=Mycolicibacillus parakoreensis TaxID=1069221 RepID=A0ABY3TY98_9MYCO|nr:hypothetical protein [Mycolicibacillus parakoreensis]MCV7316465.1 hypothetical protein [Mycolicibacillus parakoreensis]ULN52698.1 hypothetical protein MIU77_18030 [Mycolicibacillus parakoreensis]HLR98422.1 hypothetical protein [Mycolicibacillus parakoreensis]